MSFHYCLYGLTARVSERLPGLAPAAPPAGAPDLCITLGSLPEGAPGEAAPWFASPGRSSAGEPLLVVRRPGDGRFHLRYTDGTEFVVDVSAGRVWARWPEGLGLENTATYLLGPVLGFSLRMRGATCLHASAVEAGGKSLVLAGPAGAGKSTTAAAFARAGFRVLCDDVLPLVSRADGRFEVQPSYPQLRLWPDAAGALFGHEDALPRLTPGWDKRYLDLAAGEGGFRTDPVPLGAVFLLAEREAGLAEPRLAPLRGGAAVLELVANVYMGYLPDAAARARDLERLAALVRAVPVTRVTPPEDPARLPELVRALAAHAAGG